MIKLPKPKLFYSVEADLPIIALIHKIRDIRELLELL